MGSTPPETGEGYKGKGGMDKKEGEGDGMRRGELARFHSGTFFHSSSAAPLKGQ